MPQAYDPEDAEGPDEIDRDATLLPLSRAYASVCIPNRCARFFLADAASIGRR